MIRKTVEGREYESQMIGELHFDQEPKKGSFNPVTSDAVAKIAGEVADLTAIVPEGASEENKLATAADVAGVQEDVDAIEGKIPSDTSTTNKLVNESGLQDAIDNASESWSTGFTPKGESSVSDLNDLSTQSNGDSYIVTDSGTLTDGSLAVVAGDQVAWDATNSVWYKLPQYALNSFANNIAASIAPAFDPTRTSENPYKAGESVTYTDGKEYTFKVDHYGAWNASDVYTLPLSAYIVDYITKVKSYIVPVVTSLNWLDVSDVEEGYYINKDSGTVQPQPSFLYTKNYVPVLPGASFLMKGFGSGGQVAFYDFDKNFIGGALTNDSAVVTIPSNAFYARYSLQISSKETAYVSATGSTIPKDEYNFEGYFVKGSKVEGLQDLAEKQDFILIPTVVGGNWLDVSKVREGYYLSYTSGNASTIADFCYTEHFIPILAGENYVAHNFSSGGSQICFYDRDKNFISGVLPTGTTAKPFTTPSNAYYARYSFDIADKDTAYVTLSSYTGVRNAYQAGPWYVDGEKILFKSTARTELVVAKDGSGDYTTVTEAAQNIVDGGTIIVKPGLYEDEEIELWDKTINLIGEDPYTTIITNDLNTYERPPLEMSSGRLENLQFVQSGSGEPTGASGWSAFAMHSESNIMKDKTFYVKNCIFKSVQVAAVGMGMRTGCNVVFENCYFEAYDFEALYVHDAAGDSYVGVQNLTVKDCIINSTGKPDAIRLVSEKKPGTTVYCTFARNVFSDTTTPSCRKYTEGTGTATGNTNMDLVNFNLTKQSALNNIESLNYSYS